MNKFLMIIFTVISSISFNSFAAIDVYQFKDKEKQHRFQTLVAELRCPKCQNQTLADSNSELATDLRMKVYQMLEKDKSDDIIMDYMLERYGEFVLYRPRMSGQTLLLWYGPILLLITGLVIIGFIVRHRLKKNQMDDHHEVLDSHQQQTLSSLLKPNNEKKQ